MSDNNTYNYLNQNGEIYVSRAEKDLAGNVITTTYQIKDNLVSGFQTTPDNTHYPSEKLVKDSLDNKVNKNTNITAGTKCKITYDEKGLVTGGADLTAENIPELTLSKIPEITATAAEVNVLNGITATTAELNFVDGVTSKIQTQIDGKQNKLSETGSATQGIYVSSAGTISAMTYSLNKTVPSDAVFTDTTYTAGTGIKLTGTTFSCPIASAALDTNDPSVLVITLNTSYNN